MKKSLILLLAVALSGSACTGYVAAPAPGYYAPGYAGPTVGVVVSDQPYYTRGPYYVSRGVAYRWHGGHYAYHGNRRVWVHGYYVGR